MRTSRLENEMPARARQSDETCAYCDAAIDALPGPWVWCNEVVCPACWKQLDTRERQNRSAEPRRNAPSRLGFAVGGAVVSCIGGLYLLIGLELDLTGAGVVGGALSLTGLLLVVATRPWASR